MNTKTLEEHVSGFELGRNHKEAVLTQLEEVGLDRSAPTTIIFTVLKGGKPLQKEELKGQWILIADDVTYYLKDSHFLLRESCDFERSYFRFPKWENEFDRVLKRQWN